MKPPLDNFNLTPAPKGIVTQFFGENPDLYRRFGFIGHNGIDFAQPHGSPMYAIEDAYVVSVNNDPSGFGKHVRIISRREDSKGELNEWTYGHCHEIFVEIGQVVKAGDKIASMGNTGFVVSGATPFWKVNPHAGTHLHLGLRKVKRDSNGWTYPGSKFKISVLNYGNGYKGAIDPLPLLKSIIEPNKPITEEDKRIPLMKTLVGLLETYYSLLKSRL